MGTVYFSLSHKPKVVFSIVLFGLESCMEKQCRIITIDFYCFFGFFFKAIFIVFDMYI